MHPPKVVDVTANTGQVVRGPVTSWVTGDVEHLAGSAPNGDLLVFFWSPHDPGHWKLVNVSDNISGHPRIAGPVTSWVTGDVEHLAGSTPNGDLLVFFWSPHDPGHWKLVNVSQITGAKVVGTPTAYQVSGGANHTELLGMRSPDNSLLLFWWSPSHDWQAVNLSEITGQRITSDPRAWTTPVKHPSVEHLAAEGEGEGQALLVFWFDSEYRLGWWEKLPGEGTSEILAVHAALLHAGENGQILYFGGDEHDPGHNHLGLFDSARLFDCTTRKISNPGSPTTDVFCSGHAQLGDGRLLVAGGTERFDPSEGGDFHHGHNPGLPSTWIFDPQLMMWSQVAPMGEGRYYPSLVTLANGHVVAMCGHPSEDDKVRHNNDTLEVFDPGQLRWIDQGSQAKAPIDVHLRNPYPLYPRLHLLPDGDVFCVTAIPRPESQCRTWNPSSKEWRAVADGPGREYNSLKSDGSDPNTHEMITSVLLPLLPQDGYRPRVLLFGPTQPKVINLGSDNPHWQNTEPRRLLDAGQTPVRHHAIALLLPDATVLVVGGAKGGDDNSGVRIIELYDPATDQWSTLAEADVVRQYHSVALLMPDGRVWTAGSNHNRNWSFHDIKDFRPDKLPQTAQDGKIDNRERRIEIYWPPYFRCRGPRPAITAAPATLTLPGIFQIVTPDASDIQQVALLRCGSVTHAFDYDQRYVGLLIVDRTSTLLHIATPPNSKIAPPGNYLLFIVSKKRVPSVGRFVRLSSNS